MEHIDMFPDVHRTNKLNYDLRQRYFQHRWEMLEVAGFSEQIGTEKSIVDAYTQCFDHFCLTTNEFVGRFSLPTDIHADIQSQLVGLGHERSHLAGIGAADAAELKSEILEKYGTPSL